MSIARAIAKHPELFIFDDSFSALDYKTDVILRRALKEKTKDSTVLIVAQRISTILHADQIIVLDEGRVAGIGTHSELLENCEVYRQIAASQLSEAELNLSGKEAEQMSRHGHMGPQGADEKAKDLLIEHNLRLVVYVAKKYDSMQNGSIEDLISIGTIGLVKAVNTFNMDKNIKLATYASRCIENEILMFLRKNNKLRQEISLDEPLNVDYDGNELLLSDIIGTDKDIVQDEIEHNDQKKNFIMLYII